LDYFTQEYSIADYICVPSQFVADTFLERGVAERKLVINPFGVDYAYWSTCEAAKSYDQPFTFLWVAALLPRKGLGILLEAWKKANLPNARLVLAGNAPKFVTPLLDRLPPNVYLKSFLDHHAIRREMSEAHVYVLPSLEEGMARSVLEAAAAGLPLILTKETGTTDVFRDGSSGWIVPSGDVEALVGSLRAAASDPESCMVRGAKARAVVQSLSWEAYGERAANFLSKAYTAQPIGR
jgi:glycosyltransferase involved in cell wall biosynthesis